MSDMLLSEVADGVLTLTINRPDRLNALDAPVALEVYNALKKADNDPAVRVVVLTGSGRGFCAGADLTRDRDAEAALDAGDLLTHVNNTVTLISTLRKPVISAINGVAAGVGVSYALAADISISKESASFILAFSRIGLMPDGGATLWVAAAIGRARAMHMALTGEKIPAAQAAEWGLISRVVPDDDFDTTIAELAATLGRGPTRAYSKTKDAINASSAGLLAAALERETVGQTELISSKDNAEGVAAFRDKRQPQFTGE